MPYGQVMIYADGREPMLAAEAIARGRAEVRLSELEQFRAEREGAVAKFAAEEYRYLVIPDVALQKARLVE